LKEPVLRILTGLFDAASHWDPRRLPELFCGFARRQAAPTLYPVACSPQAWSSGALFMMLQASLGLSLDAVPGRLSFNHPALPEWLGELNLRGLRVGAAQLDLDIRRHERDVEINVVNRQGNVQVIVTK
jgi:glycogen debranching enzyme